MATIFRARVVWLVATHVKTKFLCCGQVSPQETLADILGVTARVCGQRPWMRLNTLQPCTEHLPITEMPIMLKLRNGLRSITMPGTAFPANKYLLTLPESHVPAENRKSGTCINDALFSRTPISILRGKSKECQKLLLCQGIYSGNKFIYLKMKDGFSQWHFVVRKAFFFPSHKID